MQTTVTGKHSVRSDRARKQASAHLSRLAIMRRAADGPLGWHKKAAVRTALERFGVETEGDDWIVTYSSAGWIVGCYHSGCVIYLNNGLPIAESDEKGHWKLRSTKLAVERIKPTAHVHSVTGFEVALAVADELGRGGAW